MTTPFLKVLRAGPHICVQDEGRPGYLRSGVSQGGAMDPMALEEGRLLVGNEPGLAAIEMLGLGGRFEVLEGVVCAALSGAVFAADVDGKKLAPNTSFSLEPGQILEIGAAVNGNYGLLSISGGVNVERVLGSRSTHVRAGFGGFEGRCLKSGDVLPLGLMGEGPGGAKVNSRSGYQLPFEDRQFSDEVRILWGAQVRLFSKDELQRFVETEFLVSHEIDRMGARLSSEAAPISSQKGLVAISGAIAPGDIQVPGNGRPIVLLADRQPTGGYPRIATIIAADIADFAQRPPGSTVRFSPVSESEAIAALEKRRDRRQKLPEYLVRAIADPYESHRLLSQNLISGVISSVGPKEFS